MRLPHRTPKCTGAWFWDCHGTLVYWRCDTCRALAYPSVEINRAITREHLLGREIVRLAAEGRELLEGA